MTPEIKALIENARTTKAIGGWYARLGGLLRYNPGHTQGIECLAESKGEVMGLSRSNGTYSGQRRNNK